jgi:hypothetical protein
MGMDIIELMELPEYLYIQQLMEFMQQLPDAVQKPICVKDASAFNSFLGDAGRSYFEKYLVLHSLNDATWQQPDHRFRGEHYVSCTQFVCFMFAREPHFVCDFSAGTSHSPPSYPAWRSHVCCHDLFRYTWGPCYEWRECVARIVQGCSSTFNNRFVYRTYT